MANKRLKWLNKQNLERFAWSAFSGLTMWAITGNVFMGMLVFVLIIVLQT